MVTRTMPLKALKRIDVFPHHTLHNQLPSLTFARSSFNFHPFRQSLEIAKKQTKIYIPYSLSSLHPQPKRTFSNFLIFDTQRTNGLNLLTMIPKEERHNTFRPHADEFIKTHGRGRDSHWLHNTEILRSNINPDLFDYYERRNRGEEPPPDNFRWPRSQAQMEQDWAIITLKVWDKEGGDAIFNTIDYNKAYSGRDVKNLEDSPLDQDLGPTDETKAQDGWYGGPGAHLGKYVTELPDQRAEGVDYQSVDPSNIEAEDTASPSKIPSECAQNWQSQRPKIVRRSREKWTRHQEKQLIYLVTDLETEDWKKIASEMQKSETECQERYREVADLPLHNRSRRVWTAKEDADLLRFRDEYQSKDWVRMSSQLEHSVEDCQERYNQLTMSLHSARSKSINTEQSGTALSSAPTEGLRAQSPAIELTELEPWREKRQREAEDDGAEFTPARKSLRTDRPTVDPSDDNARNKAIMNGDRPKLIPRGLGQRRIDPQGREEEQPVAPQVHSGYSPRSPSYSPISSEDEWPSKKKRRDILFPKSDMKVGPGEKRGRNRTREEGDIGFKTPELMKLFAESPKRWHEPRKPLGDDAQSSNNKRTRDGFDGDEDTARPSNMTRLLPPKSPAGGKTEPGDSKGANKNLDEPERDEKSEHIGPLNQKLEEAEAGAAEAILGGTTLQRGRKRRHDASEEEQGAHEAPPKRAKRVPKAQKNGRPQGNQADRGPAAESSWDPPRRRSSRIRKQITRI